MNSVAASDGGDKVSPVSLQDGRFVLKRVTDAQVCCPPGQNAKCRMFPRENNATQSGPEKGDGPTLMKPDNQGKKAPEFSLHTTKLNPSVRDLGRRNAQKSPASQPLSPVIPVWPKRVPPGNSSCEDLLRETENRTTCQQTRRLPRCLGASGFRTVFNEFCADSHLA